MSTLQSNVNNLSSTKADISVVSNLETLLNELQTTINNLTKRVSDLEAKITE